MHIHKKFHTGFIYGIVLLAGAAVMVVELVGARIIAPHVGMSLYAWTALIGVILASLSVGYWWGGVLADRNPRREVLGMILLAAAAATVFIFVSRFWIFSAIDIFTDLRLRAFLAASGLFVPVSILLGMVSPYAARLLLVSLDQSGRTIGMVSALSAAGSITGTFVAGFLLIPLFSIDTLLVGTAVTLALLSLVFAGRRARVGFVVAFGVAIMIALAQVRARGATPSVLADVDTPYYRAIVFEGVDGATGRRTINLMTDPYHIQGMRYADGDDDIVPGYPKFYRMAYDLVPSLRRALMIGGGAFMFPKDYARSPERSIDVVEIDPGITSLAEQFFNLDLSAYPNIAVHHEDGRVFLNESEAAYDAIFIDAFNSLYPPVQLATQETVRAMRARLVGGGVVLVNIPGAIYGDAGKLFRAQRSTYQSVFSFVDVFLIQNPFDPYSIQNIMLVASDKPLSLSSENPNHATYLAHLWKGEIEPELVLTDDYAPVESYALPLIQRARHMSGTVW